MAAELSHDADKGKDIPYEVDRTRYDSFAEKWMACIRSTHEYDTVFHPTPLMNHDNIFGPPPALYETKTILLACRVFTSDNLDRYKAAKLFRVESLTLKGKTLAFSYTVDQSPAGDGSFLVGLPLQVIIPKSDYAQVVFIENQIKIGTLDLTTDQWHIPMPDENRKIPKR